MDMGGGMECNLPNIRGACCDMSRLGTSCAGDQTCMQNGMAAFPPAEQQWFQANAGPSACPGMAAIQADPASMMSHCTMNGQPIPSGPPPGSEHVFAAISLVSDPIDWAATSDCHMDMGGGMECNLPNIRRACCDMSQLGPSCGSDQTCMMNGMAAFPPAEQQWFQANAGPSACPGMGAAIQVSQCTMNGQPIPSGPPPGSEHVFAALSLVSDPIDWTATSHCHLDVGEGRECNLPNIRRACCDFSQLGASCRGDQTCMQNGMAAFPPAELQWFQANQDSSALPGLVALQSDPVTMMTHCTSGDVFAALSLVSGPIDGHLAIVTAQQSQPEVQSSVVPGVLGFAIGAAVVTSVVAMKKKRASGDMYTPLTESA